MGRVITRAQLAIEGVAPSTITARCKRGFYTRLLPGVFCEGEVTTLARCAAVVEWLPEAYLSHRTAAWLLGMLTEPELVEATVPSRRYRRTPSWLRLYRRDLPPGAFTEQAQLPITTPARTLFDCIQVLPEDDANRLVDDHLRRTVDPVELDRWVRFARKGAPVARRQLREAAIFSMSEPERIFARALARRKLGFFANAPVGPFVCDFVHERSRTVVEVDGRRFHSGARVFRADRRRQNWLLTHDWQVLRFAALDVIDHLDRCVDEVEREVRRRRRVAKSRTFDADNPEFMSQDANVHENGTLDATSWLQ
ncbi:DUF559 domain-containing protein [Nocardia camponoti]|uniref:DUF559 domain-containing protein n=1 Tax=Nocardia camponoti TaxID=1616106 RepID=UPI00166DFF66|nr:DUF559 domain-containing protein [Nocardia camponoti]